MTENSNVHYFDATQTSEPRRFRRSSEDRMIAGVCGGAARALNVDSAIIRVVLVAATLLGFGLGILLYLTCWLIVPQE
ncbi:PspC domain-containing protein [Saccharopolyspora erythraea]|uniref:PspC domain-containing protein n=1 Tax=Saccharopolyspora erythraea TaxID=1836 RepID=UPI001BAA267A|nr:PspC domain-containing protein [Saccharopolyspora erythraea]QUG99879.1 PspC domain-containing protein [Saccharopolyspora erythraea]